MEQDWVENPIKNIFNRLSVKNLARIGVRVSCLSKMKDSPGRWWWSGMGCSLICLSRWNEVAASVMWRGKWNLQQQFCCMSALSPSSLKQVLTYPSAVARRCHRRAFFSSALCHDHYRTLGVLSGASKAQIKVSDPNTRCSCWQCDACLVTFLSSSWVISTWRAVLTLLPS